MPSNRKRPTPSEPDINRRSAPDTPMLSRLGRRLRGLLTRPMRVQNRGDGLKLVVVERRRKPQDAARASVAQARLELRERLLAHDLGQAAAIMRPLVKVHDALRDGGWDGLDRLAEPILSRALVQAEIIAGGDPSPALSQLIERLRLSLVAARLRIERNRDAAAAEAPAVEVSELSADEFSTLYPAHAITEPHDEREAQAEREAGPVSQR